MSVKKRYSSSLEEAVLWKAQYTRPYICGRGRGVSMNTHEAACDRNTGRAEGFYDQVSCVHTQCKYSITELKQFASSLQCMSVKPAQRAWLA